MTEDIFISRRYAQQKKQLESQKKQIIQLSQDEQMKSLTSIYTTFQTNLHQFATKYKENINKDPDFRDKFNSLCDVMEVNPMLSRKTMWSELGFGDFYNQLAMQILDICSKKKSLNGGLMKVNDVILDFRTAYKANITMKDIQRALKTIDCLGGCQMNKDYICTVPIELSGDFNILLDSSEEFGYVSMSVMIKTKNWTKDRFDNTIDVLRREGLVWVDKKTGSNEFHFYFPAMLNRYFESKSLIKRIN